MKRMINGFANMQTYFNDEVKTTAAQEIVHVEVAKSQDCAGNWMNSTQET